MSWSRVLARTIIRAAVREMDREMRALRLLVTAWSGIACATMPVAGEAYFQLSAPWRFAMSGNAIRFDEVSIAETVVPCTRTGARVKLQVRATSKPYQPPEAQRNLPLQPYQSVEAHGYLLAEHDVGKLGPAEFGCPYEAFNVTLPVTPPPPG